jgi:DNA polymerase V
VVVLSNNDGCVVSRSQEAKALGVPMGIPYFKVRDLLRKNNGVVLSSNFELYADMSQRVMRIIGQFSPSVEYYSIDEAFLYLDYLGETDYEKLGEKLQKSIKKQTGIPVSVGLGQTKVLAKTANEVAKQNPLYQGVFSFIGLSEAEREQYLQQVPVESLWGVGWQSAPKLVKRGIVTAADFARADEQVIRKIMTISGMKLVLELRGRECFGLDDHPEAQKSVLVSRSFAELITDRRDLEEAVATHAFHAARQLRKQNLHAKYLTVFLHTSHHRRQDTQYHPSGTISLLAASNYAADFIAPALKLVKSFYQPNIKYKKSGVVLSGLTPVDSFQQNLLDESANDVQRVKYRLNRSLDQLNQKYGREFLRFGAMGLQRKWYMRRQLRSPRYTTNLNELLKVQ